MPPGRRSASVVKQLPKTDSRHVVNLGSTIPSRDVVAKSTQQMASAISRGSGHEVTTSPQPQSGHWLSEPATSTADLEPSHQTPLTGSQSSPRQMPLGQHLDNSLPDLRELMYPSTNPFAYGNQPLSALEDSQMIVPDQQTSFSAATSTFEVPTSNCGPSNISFDNFSISAFGSLPAPSAYAPQRLGATPMPRGNPTHMTVPQSIAVQEMGNTNTYEGFWQQMDRGRTALTPVVNLDELFGADSEWNPGYMDQEYDRTQ